MTIKNKDSVEFIDELLLQDFLKKHMQDLKDHHDDSFLHCTRVGKIAVDIGYENKLPPQDIRLLGLSGLLHDLGKCDIADELLSKPSALSDEERDDVRKHPRLGFLKLDGSDFDEVKQIVISHHEFKLSPYPRNNADRRISGRDGERRKTDKNISSLSEILAISDMFDALASARSYKKAFDKTQIENILKEQFTGNKDLIPKVLSRF